MPKVLVDVPDALDELARERGQPLAELARQALAEWIREVQEDTEDARIAVERWDALQRGGTTERDWDEFVAELTRRRGRRCPKAYGWSRRRYGMPAVSRT